MRTLRILALAIGLAPAALAEDAPPPDPVAAFFTEFDADGDGAVSRRELAGVSATIFALLDRDGDGLVRREEVARRGPRRPDAPPGGGPAPGTPGMSAQEREARLKEAFARRDTDGDGFLAGEEVSPRLLAAADRNGDGKVDWEEYGRALPQRGGPPGPRRDGAPAPTEPAPSEAPVAPDPFRGQDRDGDGRLNRTEWSGSQEDWLRLDADRNGWVTREEMSASARPDARGEPGVRPGAPAPEFSLPAADGTTWSTRQVAGKWVVLEWTNLECPFVRKHYDSGNLQRLQKEWRERGVIWLSVCSSAPGKPGHMDAEGFRRALAENGAAPDALLMDPAGAVGRAFGARTTPHVFVLDPQGRLAYEGAVDDRPGLGRAALEGARCYVSEVLEAGLAGKEPPVRATRSYG